MEQKVENTNWIETWHERPTGADPPGNAVNEIHPNSTKPPTSVGTLCVVRIDRWYVKEKPQS